MKKNAFTLIELLVVVGVLGLLAAIAIPKYGEAIEKANLGATLGNLSSLRSAINIYAAENLNLPDTIDININSDFRKNIGNVMPFVKAKRPYTNPPYGNGVVTGTSIPNTMGSGWYYNSIKGEVYINSIANDILGYCYTIY